MAIHASQALCTVASLFVGGALPLCSRLALQPVLRREKTSNRVPLLKKGMKASNSALSATRSTAASAAPDPVLRRCPGPKAAQRAGRENKTSHHSHRLMGHRNETFMRIASEGQN